MPQKTQTKIITTLILIFLIVGTYLVLSLLGYILNPKTLKLEKTGSVYLSYNERNATLIINGIARDVSPGFIDNSVLVNKLKPGIYSIELLLPGFHPYKKTVRVETGKVARIPEITLHPLLENESQITSSTISNFALVQNEIVIESNNKITTANKTKLRGHRIVSSAKNSPFLITEENGTHYLVNTNRPESVINLNSLILSLIKEKVKNKLSFNFTETAESLISIETEKNNYHLNPTTLTLQDDALIKTQSENDICQKAKHPKVLINNNWCAIYSASGTLSLIQNNTKQWEIASPEPKLFTSSKNGKFIAFLDAANTIRTSSLEYDKDEIYTERKINQLDFPDSGKITSIAFNPENERELIILKQNEVWRLERDFRKPVNASLIKPDIKKMELLDKYLILLTNQGNLTRINL